MEMPVGYNVETSIRPECLQAFAAWLGATHALRSAYRAPDRGPVERLGSASCRHV